MSSSPSRPSSSGPPTHTATATSTTNDGSSSTTTGADDVRLRLQQLQALVEKRRQNLEDVRRVLLCRGGAQGGACWLDCVVLSRDRLKQLLLSEEAEVGGGGPGLRAVQFFHLGISLAKVLDQHHHSSTTTSPGLLLVKDLAQLFEEYEYHHHSASSAVQSVKLLMLARPSDFLYPELNSTNSTASSSQGVDEGGPRIYRFANEVVYQHLHPVCLSFPLDYVEVLDSLCHCLDRLYSSLLPLGGGVGPLLHTHDHAPPTFDALLRLDAKVRHYVLTPVAKELTELSLKAAKAELDWLRQDYVATTTTTTGGGRLLT